MIFIFCLATELAFFDKISAVTTVQYIYDKLDRYALQSFTFYCTKTRHPNRFVLIKFGLNSHKKLRGRFRERRRATDAIFYFFISTD